MNLGFSIMKKLIGYFIELMLHTIYGPLQFRRQFMDNLQIIFGKMLGTIYLRVGTTSGS